ncbi:MAG TPA: flagellar biosynthesis protein FliQ [Nitrospirales bacterium]|nr:flagellar biosynthesis protein FliQ [Nitrospirales bacterium]
MTPDNVMDLGRSAIETMLLLSAPMLGFSLGVGLLVSIFQAMTQINEATLSFVPKILAVVLAFVLFLPWLMSVSVGFTVNLLMNIPMYAH